MKYVIFSPKLPGEPLPQHITDNLVGMARRGKITEKAKDLILVPDKRGTYRDKNGIKFRGWGRVKKSECIRLGDIVPR